MQSLAWQELVEALAVICKLVQLFQRLTARTFPKRKRQVKVTITWVALVAATQ